jgi:hypothetical protein
VAVNRSCIAVEQSVTAVGTTAAACVPCVTSAVSAKTGATLSSGAQATSVPQVNTPAATARHRRDAANCIQ